MEKRTRLFCPACEVVVQPAEADEGNLCCNCQGANLVMVNILLPGQPPGYEWTPADYKKEA